MSKDPYVVERYLADDYGSAPAEMTPVEAIKEGLSLIEEGLEKLKAQINVLDLS